ncbi:hypothetical protein ABK040_001418 [Willaertia magna]
MSKEPTKLSELSTVDMEKLGIFSQPSYITINDDYDKRQILKQHKQKDGRTLGKQFLTTPTKRGKVGRGITFGEFKSLYEGDPYEDPGTNDRKNRKENEKEVLKVHKTPWKPSSPPKRAPGLGTYFGTIGGVYEHKPEYNVLQRDEKPKPPQPQKKPIYTSPPKKGTFGFGNLTISKGTEYKYETDPYEDTISKLKKEEEKKQHSKMKPFVSSSHGLDYFDTHKFVAAPKVLGTDERVEEMIKKNMTRLSQSPPKKEDEKKKPFYPSPVAAKDDFPPYQEDPYDKRELNKKDFENQPKKPIFKPVSGPKSTPTKSVLFGSPSLSHTM